MSNGVIEVNHNQTREHLIACYKARLPLFIWGETGIGKSDTVRQAAKELDVDIIDVRISQLDPSDLRGLPKYSDGEETTRWLPPNWLPREGKGILLLDELNLAPPSIQSTAYQLILDRKIGDYVLPDGWIVVGAGNRAEDRANVFTMAAPLRNRLLQITLRSPGIEEWSDWALENDIDKDIIAFLFWKKSYLNNFQEDKDASVFATPRSWYFTSRLIGANGKGDIKQLAASAVGEGVAREFQAFKNLNGEVDLLSILDHPDKVRGIDRVDRKYVLVSALSGKYESDRKSLKKVLKVAIAMDPEFGILLARMLKKGNKHFSNDFKILARKKEKVVDAFIKRYAKYLSKDDIKSVEEEK